MQECEEKHEERVENAMGSTVNKKHRWMSMLGSCGWDMKGRPGRWAGGTLLCRSMHPNAESEEKLGMREGEGGVRGRLEVNSLRGTRWAFWDGRKAGKTPKCMLL